MDATTVGEFQAEPHAPRLTRLAGSSARSALPIATRALVVALAYYVGANIGFILRFPPMTPSVLWPPNSILTAALLLAPMRWWWIYLLAALPAHLVAELGAAWPLPLVLTLFATNCSEALIAAGCIRRFSDDATRVDTLRRLAVFLVSAVFLAPFVSSFVDAAAVTAFHSEPYWLVWRTRLFSNVLTALTLVPALVMAITAGPTWIRRAPVRRRVEAALLAAGLMVTGFVVFVGIGEQTIAIPGMPVTPLAFILPFTLWAAVRFGPGGCSVSLLATTLLATAAATHNRGPFAGLPVADAVLALQISLVVVAIPLMCLAALIEERRRAERALGDRLRFEELLSRLSGAFVHLASHEMDRAFESWLRQLGEFFAVDRITISRLSADGQELAVSYSWTAPDREEAPRVIPSRDFPWMLQRMLAERLVVFSHRDGLPAEAAYDEESLRRRGIRSIAMIPLVARGGVPGAVAFASVSDERRWPDELIQRLQLVAEVLANALARKETEDALRASELMKSAILGSLTSSVAVLARDGRIIAVNESWTRSAGDHGAASAVAGGVGTSYFDHYRHATHPDASDAAEAAAGIMAVLERRRPTFALEYAGRAPEQERWFLLSVVPLNRPEGGAVVSHIEVTERKHAELDAQRTRQELAHFTRVSAMGELTASLAHELNQPLTGILTNAQAARRFLDATPPAIGELGDILTDIIEDDKRAAEVIQRLRGLLRKGDSERVRLDLNGLVRDVAKLLSSDAIIRNVTVTLDCSPEPAFVNGDRIQLQQVVLNLLLNAMEAMADDPHGDRTVSVRTTATAQAVRVAVEDAGPGLRDGTQELVFEPFYTTKPAGMGMGLSIVRSIIKMHDGVIRATNNADRGATFEFALPLASRVTE